MGEEASPEICAAGHGHTIVTEPSGEGPLCWRQTGSYFSAGCATVRESQTPLGGEPSAALSVTWKGPRAQVHPFLISCFLSPRISEPWDEWCSGALWT